MLATTEVTTSSSSSFDYSKVPAADVPGLKKYATKLCQLERQHTADAVESGFMLNQARAKLPHGQFSKWCVRECERCARSRRGKYSQPLELRDFSKRIYNQPRKHEASE